MYRRFIRDAPYKVIHLPYSHATYATTTKDEPEAEPLSVTSPDSQLISAIRLNDSHAFALLMQRHLQRVLAVSQRIMGNEADADEVTQETFMRFWNYAPKWETGDPAGVRTWLNRVATNLCIDRLRRQRNVPLDEAGEIEDETPNAADTIQKQDRREVFRSLLLKLPPRQRAAIVLAYYEDMTITQIAQAMELTQGAADSLLVRGRKNLRDLLAKRGIKLEEDV